jgi:hypothetical protein
VKATVIGTLRPQPLSEDQPVEDDEESLPEEMSKLLKVPVSH